MFSFFPPLCTTPLLKFSYTFLLLIIYSILGWCGEMIYCSAGQRKLCEKRGFLNGPVCPIYGHGALVVLLCLHGGCKNPLLTFLLGAVLTSLVEYITSFAMEKLFHMRWWDYSQYKFHLNGRICLLNSTLFGLASVFLCHFANPPISAWLAGLLASGAAVPLSLILLAVYLTDIVLSVRGAIQLGGRLARLHAIYGELSEKLESMTAEARQTVHTKLEERGGELTARLEAVRQEAQQKLRTLYDRQSLFERRLLRSFPTMRSIHYPEAMKKWKEYLEFRKK
ncbi:MAG: putative ABC transporter permease [Oscillospiraceae bacterium]|nr:putative ABC transporter permease [Oscillospiraceae bacterium]